MAKSIRRLKSWNWTWFSLKVHLETSVSRLPCLALAEASWELSSSLKPRAPRTSSFAPASSLSTSCDWNLSEFLSEFFWAKNLQCGELLFQVFVFQEEFVELALVAVPATRVTVNIVRTFEVSSLIPVPGQVIADMHQGKRGETCPRGHSPFYQPTSYPAT